MRRGGIRLPRPAPALALFAILLLAGCAAPSAAPEDAPATPAAADVEFEDYALDDATISAEDLANATLGAEHVHDAWGDAEELVLLDATLQAGLCEGEFDAAAYLFVRALEGEAAYGCVRMSLPEGVVVPEGAAELRVEVDATQSLKSGSMAFQWRNKAREEETPPTTFAAHTWRIELTEADWDVPHAPATTFVMYVAARGPVGVFDGPVHARIVAERLPAWEPVLAIAHVDHWKLPALHDMPAPGVMRLLDAEATVTNVDPARLTGGGTNDDIELADIIAPGASFVTVVVDRTSTDCAPGLDCWLVPNLVVGGFERTRFGTLVHEDGERRVYAWRVPGEAPEDSVYAKTSTTRIEPRIDACAETAREATCGYASILSGSASARLRAFSWQGEVDLALLAQILAA